MRDKFFPSMNFFKSPRFTSATNCSHEDYLSLVCLHRTLPCAAWPSRPSTRRLLWNNAMSYSNHLRPRPAGSGAKSSTDSEKTAAPCHRFITNDNWPQISAPRSAVSLPRVASTARSGNDGRRGLFFHWITDFAEMNLLQCLFFAGGRRGKFHER